jgi:hypothetical protein
MPTKRRNTARQGGVPIPLFYGTNFFIIMQCAENASGRRKEAAARAHPATCRVINSGRGEITSLPRAAAAAVVTSMQVYTGKRLDAARKHFTPHPFQIFCARCEMGTRTHYCAHAWHIYMGVSKCPQGRLHYFIISKQNQFYNVRCVSKTAHLNFETRQNLKK